MPVSLQLYSALSTNMLDCTCRVLSYRGHCVQDYKIECDFSSDGAFVLSGSEDGNVYWWDLVDAKRTHSFVAHKKPVRALACHPESTMFATGCIDGSAKVWSNS